MGFNGSGSYARLYSWVSDAASGIDISSSKMDAEDDGFADGLTNCITKDGQSTTTAMIPFALGLKSGDGTAAAPAITFSADTDNGLYRIGTNNYGLAAGGSKVIDIATTGVSITGTLTASGAINKVTITAPATGSTLTIADGKTLTASNTLTFTGTDGSSVNVGAGGTLSAMAYSTDAADLTGTLDNARLASTVVVSNLTVNTAATIPGYTPIPTSFATVGYFAIAQTDTAVSDAATVAGTHLFRAKWSSSGTIATSSAMAGTWRNMTGTNLSANEFGVFVRTG